MPGERQERARYPRHRASVKAARTHARQVAVEWGLGKLEDDLVLIVSELMSNAIIHGKTSRGREIGLTFDLSPLRLRVEVKDSGDGQPHQLDGGAANDGESGRGLTVVEALAAKWGVTERVIGKTVWAEISLNREQATGGTTIQPADANSAVSGEERKE